MKSLKVKALPRNLKEFIEVDITDLDLNGNIRVEDVKLEDMEIMNSPRIPMASVVLTRQLKQEAAADAKEDKKKNKAFAVSGLDFAFADSLFNEVPKLSYGLGIFLTVAFLTIIAPAMEKFLIVGLGNIGQEYEHTRHNIGFDVVEAFAQKHNATWQGARLAAVCQVKLKGRLLTLIKPTTYMNLSGRAFKYWMDHEKVALDHTLTVVDEIALPLERLRLRASGSDAGHNGLKDIQAVMGTDAYPKLRFGIGNQFPKGRQVEFVLGRWTAEELPVVSEKTAACVEVIEQFVLADCPPQ